MYTKLAISQCISILYIIFTYYYEIVKKQIEYNIGTLANLNIHLDLYNSIFFANYISDI